MVQTAVRNFVLTAKRNNIPKDQLLNFLRGGYVPLKWQWKFHSIAREADQDGKPIYIGVGGARGPGKSHSVFAQITLDDCQRIPGLKCLFLRQTGKAARESFEDLLMKVLIGRVRYRYDKSNSTLHFPNGSRVLLGGFRDERDIDQYIGIEYDLIAIEELNQLTEEKVEKLLGSMRTTKINWRSRMYCSFNAGGIGHLFVKKKFVDPYIFREEKDTRFIPAIYKDNPYLKKEYIQYLEGLTGSLGKAWREGNFDIFQGQFFSEWDREKHIVEPFKIPEFWKKFRSYDHGRENPACCKWYALDHDGRLWVYREFYKKGLNIDQIAKEINELSEGEEYEYSVADPSIFAKMGFVDRYGGQTIAETFARYGIVFIPASNRRIDGWNLVHQYLYWDKNHYPKLLHFKTCVNSIKTYPMLIHDSRKPEDVDTKGEDHAQDCDRYMILSLHERKSEKPKTEVELKLNQKKKDEYFSPDQMNKFYYG